jgi:hypothetical protein
MIPKIVHVTWKTKDILNRNAFIVENGLKNFIKLNPEWKVTIYDDDEVDEYLKNMLDTSDYKLIENKHIVEKSDLWRLFKIYFEGGMYVDVDRVCNKKLSDVIDDNIRWVLPVCRTYDFSHDIMISAPENPAYFNTINLYLSRIGQGITNTYFLGPQTYMHGITSTLFGKIINTNPGEEMFGWMVNEIRKIPFIKLYQENPPHQTVLFDGNSAEFDHELMKRQLYKDTGITHWTGEW